MAAAVKVSERCLTQRFEVFGKVQQVFFRAHTEEAARAQDLTGFCVNTKGGTVRGEVQACFASIVDGSAPVAGGTSGDMNDARQEAERRLAVFRSFLHRGSPQSRVDRIELGEVKELPRCDWNDFAISRGGKDRERG